MKNVPLTKSLEARRAVWAALEKPGLATDIASATGLHMQTVRLILQRWEQAGLLIAERCLERHAWRKRMQRRPLKRWTTTAVDHGKRALTLNEQAMLWRASRTGRNTAQDLGLACGLPPALCNGYLSHLVLAGYYDIDRKGRLCLGAWPGPASPLIFTTGITFDANLCDVVWSPVDDRFEIRRAA